MARRSPTGRFPALRQGRRRETVWIGLSPAITSLNSSGVVLIGSLNAAALAIRPFTIVRSRGWLKLISDQTANTENSWCSYGHIVVKETATAVGITAIPTPITEITAEFHVYEQISAGLKVVSAASTFEAGFQKEFDSKAMRKVDLNDDIAVVIEAPASGISEGMTLTDGGRVLVKLH